MRIPMQVKKETLEFLNEKLKHCNESYEELLQENYPASAEICLNWAKGFKYIKELIEANEKKEEKI